MPESLPANQTSPATSTGGDDLRAHMARILEAVEQRRRGRLEVAIAVVLSLASLGSTWSGYQASRWGGVASSAATAAETAEREAAEDTIVALQIRTFDGLEVLELWRTLRSKDEPAAEIMITHMPPRLQVAVRASLAAGVLSDPSQPGPLHRPEYLIPEEADAKAQRAKARGLAVENAAASRTSADYVVLTLMFASVLFFGGITGTFTNRRVRTALAGVAFVLFAVTLALLLRLPVCTR